MAARRKQNSAEGEDQIFASIDIEDYKAFVNNMAAGWFEFAVMEDDKREERRRPRSSAGTLRARAKD